MSYPHPDNRYEKTQIQIAKPVKLRWLAQQSGGYAFETCSGIAEVYAVLALERPNLDWLLASMAAKA